MTTTLTQEADVKLKAGANVSAALTTDNYTSFINEAESHISMVSKVDWVTRYGDISTETKTVLGEITSAWAAIKAITYDMSGYTSRFEAAQMLNVNWAIYDQNLRFLKKQANTNFIIGGET